MSLDMSPNERLQFFPHRINRFALTGKKTIIALAISVALMSQSALAVQVR